jgi:hypothetical protein
MIIQTTQHALRVLHDESMRVQDRCNALTCAPGVWSPTDWCAVTGH